MEQTVERVGVEEIRPRPRQVHPTEQPIPPRTDYARLISVLQAISTVLAIRLFLLISVCGSIGLAFSAMSQTDYHGIWVLVAYCTLTVLPLVYLSTAPRQGG